MFKKIIFLGIFLQVTYAQSLLWKIECETCPGTSYLYGTMHVKDSRAFQFSDSLLPAIESCELFALEVAMDSINPFSFMSVMMLPPGKTLRNYYSKKKYKIVEKKFKEKTGKSLAFFNKMKPFFIQSMLSEKVIDNKEKDFLDLHLYNLAKEKNKKMVGLENIQDQINALNYIPIKEQAKNLYEALTKNHSEDEKLMQEMIENYAKADLNALYELIKKTEYKDDFLKKLLDDRNITMANRFAEYAQKNTIFGAIGAGHLPGNQGVLQLLKNKGFQVSPVK
jgi:uncharacterized protein YbaP (TraB family)